jgi:hypothetical protein
MKEIRVVDTAQGVADILTLSERELTNRLQELADGLERDAAPPANSRDPAHDDQDDARLTRRELMTLVPLARQIRRRELEEAIPGAIELISTRQLMYDRGIVPFGRNTTTAMKTKAVQLTSPDQDDARPPRPVELWSDTPPKGSTGQMLASWATAAADEDRLTLDALFVVPATIGRSHIYHPQTEIEWRSLHHGLFNGRTSAELWIIAAGLLAFARRENRSTVQHERLTDLASRAQQMFQPGGAILDGKQIAKAFPRLKKTRLAPGTYTRRWSLTVATPTVFATELSPNADGLRELSTVLNQLYDFAESAAASLVVRAVLTPESFGALQKKVAVPQKAAAPQKKVAGPPSTHLEDVKWLAQEIQKARGEPLSKDCTPLELAGLVAVAGGENALRDRILDRQDEVNAFLAKLSQRRADTAHREALRQASEEQTVRARQYLIILETKLGRPRLEQVVHKLASDSIHYDIDCPRDVLAAIRATDPRAKKTKAPKGETSPDANLVLAEYDNRLKEWELQLDNTCPHVNLLRQYRAADSLYRQRSLMRRIQEYLPTKLPQQTWISCKRCSFRLMCPHVLTLHDLKQQQAPYETIRRALAKFADETQASSATYTTFCKICSEELFFRAEDARDIEAIGAIGGLNSDFRKFLWGKMMRIGDPPRGVPPLLRYSQPVDPSRFAAEASDICHPLAILAQSSSKIRQTKGFARRKRNAEEEEYSPGQQLLGIIYLYAYLFGLVLGLPPRRNRDSTREEQTVKVSLDGVRSNTSPDILASTLLTHLVKTHPLLLSQLDNVTHEQIGNQFRDAYRHIQDTHGRMMLVAQDGAKVFMTNVTKLDPYFALVRSGVESSGEEPLRWTHTPAQAARLFKIIMGVSLTDLLAEKFSKEYMPFVRAVLARRGGIEYPTGVAPEWAYYIPEIRLYKKAWGTRDKKALRYWEQLLVSGKARRGENDLASMVINSATGGAARPRRHAKAAVASRRPAGNRPAGNRPAGNRPAGNRPAGNRPAGNRQQAKIEAYTDGLYLTILYSTMVYDEPTWARYLEVLDLARAREAPRLQDQAYWVQPSPNNYSAELKGPSPQIGVLAPISQLYDEEGEPHVWSIYLWRDTASGNDKQFTRKDLNKALNTARIARKPSPVKGCKFKDWVCSTCGAHWSQTGSLDAEKVRFHLSARVRLDTFYVYYESRCPAGGLHEFNQQKATPECSKCQIKTNLLTPHGRRDSPKEALAFFQKYVKVFEKDGGRSGDYGQETRSDAPTPQGAKQPSKPTERDFDSVLRLTTLLTSRKRKGGRPPPTTAEIESMGGGGGRTAEEVRSGQKAPPPPEDVDNPRLQMCDNNFRELLSRYCVYFYERQDRGAPKKFALLPRALKLAEAYFVPYRAMLAGARAATQADQTQWATALMYFSIDTFCRVALEMVEAGDNETAGFVIDTVSDILRKESMFTIPGEFKWAVFGDAEDSRGSDQASISMSAADSTTDDIRRYGDPGAGTEDVLAKKERDFAAGVAGSENQFSLEAVDIDADVAAANLDN